MKVRVDIHWGDLFDFQQPATLKALMRALPAASLAAGLVMMQFSGFGIVPVLLVASIVFVAVELLVAAVVLGMANTAVKRGHGDRGAQRPQHTAAR